MSQTAELTRDQSNIAYWVEAFARERWQTARADFYMRELHDYIFLHARIAPASADRILRQLRGRGKVNYTVLNRANSFYRITAVAQGPKLEPIPGPVASGTVVPAATVRNPKQEGTPFWDCIPQAGPCPMKCNQCFYNRPHAYYVPIDKPHVPSPQEVGDGIVRMNCGNDSNNKRDLVIETAKTYKRFFFNTSIPRFDFPGPVVLTANPKEEDVRTWTMPVYHNEGWYSPAPNLMFVRLRTSSTNLDRIDTAVAAWTEAKVPVVITFMAYYDHEPQVPAEVWQAVADPCYEWKVRHINSYWCPTKEFMRYVMGRYADNRLVSMCSSIESSYCRNCRNCETHYLQTMKRLRGE